MAGLRVLATVTPRKPEPKPSKRPVEKKSMQYFAGLWSVNVSTIYRWTQLHEDPLPSEKVQGTRRIPVQQALSWWSRHSGKSKEA